MSRNTRVEFDGALYHVMSRGVARMPVFLADVDRMDFLDRVGTLVEAGDIVIHAFCLMPNHYHLLCETPHGRLGKLMRHINGDYAREFNSRHHRVGHLWQGRYKAILVGDGDYMLECSRYIHLNPNRSRLARPAERYKWSSYRNYIGAVPACVPWVATRSTLEAVGGDPARYQQWVESKKGVKPVSPFDKAVAGLVLGGETLVARVKSLLRGRAPSSEEPSLRRLAPPRPTIPLDLVDACVSQIFAGATPRRRRRLRYYALRRHASLGVTEIARLCGRTPAAISIAIRELDEEAMRNPVMKSGLDRLAASVPANDASRERPSRNGLGDSPRSGSNRSRRRSNES